MSELQLSTRYISIAVLVSALAVLAMTATVGTGLGRAAKSTKCAVVKKKKSACPKTSSRTRYKIVRRSILVSVPHATTEEGLSEVVTVECPHGERVLAGGAEITEPFLSVRLSAPNEAVTGWSAQIANFSTTTDIIASVGVFAVCELPSSVG